MDSQQTPPSRRGVRAQLAAALVVLAGLLVLAPPAPAQTGGTGPGSDIGVLPQAPLPGNLTSKPVPAWSALATRIAQPWLRLPYTNGVFDDYILGPGLRSRYGDARIVEASGLEARVIQHEMDHLDGVLILDRTSRDERKEAIRTLREAEREREAA